MNAVLHLSTRSFARFPSSLLADSVNDAASTRKVYLLAGGLALLGVVLIAITVWFWRNTRHDPELLGPLEAMGARKFARLDSRSQQQMLDAVRPPNAEPLRSVDESAEIEHGEQIDLKVAKSSVAAGYEDLRDDKLADGVGTVAPDAAAAELEGLDIAVPEVDAEEGDAGIADSDQGLVVPVPPATNSDEETNPDDAVESNADDRDESAVSAAAQEVGAPVQPATPSAGNPATVGDDAVDSTAETVLDEFAVLDAIRKRAPSPTATVRPAEPLPLVIVPMDHDLPATPPSGRPTAPAKPRNEPVAAVEPASAAVVDTEDDRADKASIDPLLRRRDRSDD